MMISGNLQTEFNAHASDELAANSVIFFVINFNAFKERFDPDMPTNP
jgi:hypothetical protein